MQKAPSFASTIKWIVIAVIIRSRIVLVFCGLLSQKSGKFQLNLNRCHLIKSYAFLLVLIKLYNSNPMKSYYSQVKQTLALQMKIQIQFHKNVYHLLTTNSKGSPLARFTLVLSEYHTDQATFVLWPPIRASFHCLGDLWQQASISLCLSCWYFNNRLGWFLLGWWGNNLSAVLIAEGEGLTDVDEEIHKGGVILSQIENLPVHPDVWNRKIMKYQAWQNTIDLILFVDLCGSAKLE